MFRRVVVFTVVVLVLAGAGVGAWTQRHRWQPPAPADAPKPPPGPIELRSVKLSDEAVRGLGLKSAPVQLETYTRVIDVPGVVADQPGVSDRAVTAPVAGVVARIHAFPGDPVRPGDPLFTLRLVGESVQTAQADLYKAAEDIRLNRALYDRWKESGSVPAARFLELDQQRDRLKVSVKALRFELLARGFTPDQVDGVEAGTFVSEVAVTAPPAPAVPTPSPAGPSAAFAFEVQALKVSPGQGVLAGQTLLTLADHRALLIEGRAFETEAALVAAAARDGKAIGVEFAETAPGPWGKVEQAFVIRSVGNTQDPASRTFPFFVPLANQAEPYDRGGKTYLAWRFRPGQKVRLRVPVGTIPNVLVLPAGAVVREGGDTFVFRQNGEQFDRKPVVVVAEDRLTVAVAPGEGITPGVYVLRNDAAAVNRALKAAQARLATGGGGKGGHWHADGSYHEGHD
jgi:multidrug efflux pump subunit AcrA (membrane-fusion protein)